MPMTKFNNFFNSLSSADKLLYQQARREAFIDEINKIGKYGSLTAASIAEECNKLSANSFTIDLFEINKTAETGFYRQKCIELQIKLAEYEGQATERDNIIKQLTIESKINHLESKINQDAYNLLKNNPEFLTTIQPDELVNCTVLAIDIRRSTELMLKAKSPNDFSNFIKNLSYELNEIIIDNYGIFDKFTGDGILAFFPVSFTGEDSVLHALKAAHKCHNAFKKHYEESHSLFETVLLDTGLGIGIDHGLVKIVEIANDITVVGKPVVYACRLSSAKGGDTLLNQSAFDEFKEKSKSKIKFIHEKVKLEIKHEGSILAYKVNIDFDSTDLQKPTWNPAALSDGPTAQPASQTTSLSDASPEQPQSESNNQPSDNPEAQS